MGATGYPLEREAGESEAALGSTVDLDSPEAVYGKHEQIYTAIEQYYSEDLERELRSYVFSRFRDWSASREIARASWYLSWMLYNGYSPEARFDRLHGSNVWVPEPYKIVRTLAPRYSDGMFGANRWYGLETASEDTPPASIQDWETLLNWYRDKFAHRAKYMEATLQAGIEGVCALSWEWSLREHKYVKRIAEKDVPPKMPGDERSILAYVEMDTRVEQELRLVMTKARDYFQDMDIINIQDGFHDCGVEGKISWAEISQGMDLHKYNQHADRVLQRSVKGHDQGADASMPHEDGVSRGPSHGEEINWDLDWWDMGYEDAERMAAGESPYSFEPLGQGDVLRKLCCRRFQGMLWTKRDRRGQPILKPMDTLWVGPFMISCTDLVNPIGKVDYVPMQIEVRPGSYNAHGYIEQVSQLCAELGEFNNLTLDNAAMRTRGMYKARHSAGLVGNVIQSLPGGIVFLNNLNDLEPLDPPPGLQDGLLTMSMIRDQIRETAGVPPVLEGRPGASRETGIAVTSHQKEAMIRHLFGVQWGGEVTVCPLIRQEIGIIQMFMTRDEQVRVLGPNGYQIQRISPENIAGQYNVIPKDAEEVANDVLAVQSSYGYVRLLGDAAKAFPNSAQRIEDEFDIVELLKNVADLQRMRGRSKWVKQKRRDLKMSAAKILMHYGRGGNDLQIDQDESYLAIAQTMLTPGDNGQPAPYVKFMADPDIDATNKQRLLEYMTKLAMKADEEMKAEDEAMKKQEMLQGMMGEGGPGAGGEELPGAPTPPQERPTSPEAAGGPPATQETAVRTAAQAPVAPVMQQKTQGFKG